MSGFGLVQLWRIITLNADGSIFVALFGLIAVGAATVAAVRAGGGR